MLMHEPLKTMCILAEVVQLNIATIIETRNNDVHTLVASLLDELQNGTGYNGKPPRRIINLNLFWQLSFLDLTKPN